MHSVEEVPELEARNLDNVSRAFRYWAARLPSPLRLHLCFVRIAIHC